MQIMIRTIRIGPIVRVHASPENRRATWGTRPRGLLPLRTGAFVVRVLGCSSGPLPETEREKMAARSSSGGDYDLSNPIGSFADVVRRVVLQPRDFFARKPARSAGVRPGVHRDLRAAGRAAHLPRRPRGRHLAGRHARGPGLPGFPGEPDRFSDPKEAALTSFTSESSIRVSELYWTVESGGKRRE